MEGVDLSSNNGSVDYATLIPRLDFAICKATESTDYLNPLYREEIAQVRQYNRGLGHYHYARPDSSSGSEQAHYHLSQIDWRKGEPIALDLEVGSGNVTPWALEWCGYVEQALGIRPLIYTYPDFAEHHIRPDARLARYPLYWASYANPPLPVPRPWQSWTILQYTATATLPGVTGYIDRDRFDGTMADWRALGGEIMDEAQQLKDDVSTLTIPAGSLLREGIIDLRQFGAGEAERIAAYEKGVYHRFAGHTVAMVRETPGAFDIPDDESNASYDALYRRGKVVWY